MTQYKTKDGQEIKVGGVYSYALHNHVKFECRAFQENQQPVLGVKLCKGEMASYDACRPHELTSLPESQPEYDPEQMWVVWYKPDAFLRMSNIYYQSLEEAKAEIRYYSDAFAIAPVGKKFRKGDGL